MWILFIYEELFLLWRSCSVMEYFFSYKFVIGVETCGLYSYGGLLGLGAVASAMQ
jgi:hypothetical protein